MRKELEQKFTDARKAQSTFAVFTQEQVDKIFRAMALSANENRIHLARLAVEETNKGILEDKVIKNHFASEFIYNKYKDMKTAGTLEIDDAAGMEVIAAPVGVVAAITPVTNPTSTAIFKILISLKTRNAIIISPHPQAKECIIETVRIMHEAAVAAGAPEGIIQVVEQPTLQDTQDVMANADMILATGGGGLVKAAYSSGTPAIGVGAGNAPAIIADGADLETAVTSIIQSNIFDNGMICATENSVIVEASVYDKVKKLFIEAHGHIVTAEAEKNKVRKGMFKEGAYGLLHPAPVGQTPETIAKHFGIKIPAGTKLLLVEAEKTSHDEPLAHEKLSTYVALYKAKDFNDAVEKAKDLLLMGAGHTASLHSDETRREQIDLFKTLNAGRLLVNTPSSIGGVGDFYNFALAPSLTLGCGSWGGNSFAGQVGPELLMNKKRIAMRRENTQWLRVPKTYFKEGSTPEALKDLVDDGIKNALVVSDPIIWGLYGEKLSKYLNDLGIKFSTFTGVEPNPTLRSSYKGLETMNSVKPDAVIAIGGGSPIDAGKLMWFLYENPGVKFDDLALTFADIRKRIVKFPETGKKCKFIAIPTTAGTGSEVTPFSVITDEKTHKKYPLADYALLPYMAIVDSQFQNTMPKFVTAVSGMDALSHAIEAYVSVLATDFTDPYALQAIKMIFNALPHAYKEGASNKQARTQMAHAATLAGISFANAFLGIVHSLSHKLGGYHSVVHGQANALLLPYIIKYNAANKDGKVTMFSQYRTPNAKARYAEIAKHIGLTGSSDDILVNKLIDKIQALTKSVGLKTNLKDLELDKKEFDKSLDQMSEDAFDDQCTGANPRYPLISDVKAIFLEAFEGTDPKDLKL